MPLVGLTGGWHHPKRKKSKVPVEDTVWFQGSGLFPHWHRASGQLM